MATAVVQFHQYEDLSETEMAAAVVQFHQYEDLSETEMATAVVQLHPGCLPGPSQYMSEVSRNRTPQSIAQ